MKYYKHIIFMLFCLFLTFEIQAKEFTTKKEIKKLQKEFGGRSGERFSNWNILMKENKSVNKLLQARNIDKYFNQYRYRIDYKVDAEGKKYKSDFFRGFTEFIGKNGGDCDDYAIVKYFSLIKLGVPEDKLEIWIGAYKSNKINHAVLAYYVEGRKDPLILDSNTLWAVKFSKRNNFKPWIYASKSKSGVFKKTLKYNKYSELHSYENYADYFSLKIDRWFRNNSI